MRVRPAFLVFALALVFVSMTVAAHAQSGTWGVDEFGQPVFTWTADAWVGGVFTLDDYSYAGAPDGASYFELYGIKDGDPLVTQTVTNTSTATWKDWHVDILHGIISTVDAPVVHKTTANVSNWSISYGSNPGYTDGFGAVWVGGSSTVANGEKLSVRFRWTPDGSGLPVTIRQYPTDTGSPIPEPSTFLALGSCLLPMGLGAFRRRSK